MVYNIVLTLWLLLCISYSHIVEGVHIWEASFERQSNISFKEPSISYNEVTVHTGHVVQTSVLRDKGSPLILFNCLEVV